MAGPARGHNNKGQSTKRRGRPSSGSEGNSDGGAKDHPIKKKVRKQGKQMVYPVDSTYMIMLIYMSICECI
jgi:hypothetical protein